MKKILESVNKEAYPDLTIECREISNMDEYINTLPESDFSTAKKTEPVTARRGIPGEVITTILLCERDGKMYKMSETSNVVTVDDKGNPGWIVTNPGGECYIVKDSAFNSRYTANEDGTYTPISEERKVVKIYEDISFIAPWGEQMTSLSGSYLVVNGPNDVYSVGEKQFLETYSESKEIKL